MTVDVRYPGVKVLPQPQAEETALPTVKLAAVRALLEDVLDLLIEEFIELPLMDAVDLIDSRVADTEVVG